MLPFFLRTPDAFLWITNMDSMKYVVDYKVKRDLKSHRRNMQDTITDNEAYNH